MVFRRRHKKAFKTVGITQSQAVFGVCGELFGEICRRLSVWQVSP